MGMLMAHDYPGQRAGTGEHHRARIRALPRGADRAAASAAAAARRAAASGTEPAATTLHDMEGLAASGARCKHRGNRRAAARELGIHAATLFRKAKAWASNCPTDGRSRGVLHPKMTPPSRIDCRANLT